MFCSWKRKAWFGKKTNWISVELGKKARDRYWNWKKYNILRKRKKINSKSAWQTEWKAENDSLIDWLS